jgi:hypothetical protein
MMFKHITPAPWMTGRSGITVWGYEQKYGWPMITNCENSNLPTTTKRANARLISIAPQMFEVLMTLTDNPEAMELVRFMNKEQSCV